MWVATEGANPVFFGDEAVRLGNIRLDPASDSAYLLQSNPPELKTPLEGTGSSHRQSGKLLPGFGMAFTATP